MPTSHTADSVQLTSISNWIVPSPSRSAVRGSVNVMTPRPPPMVVSVTMLIGPTGASEPEKLKWRADMISATDEVKVTTI